LQHPIIISESLETIGSKILELTTDHKIIIFKNIDKTNIGGCLLFYLLLHGRKLEIYFCCRVFATITPTFSLRCSTETINLISLRLAGITGMEKKEYMPG
jgi:hypothetical protein